jgi:plastocyanin
MTKQKTVALKIDTDTAGGTPGLFTPPNIIISAGTTVTWTNLSTLPHTVVTRPGFTVPQSFASSVLAAGSGTFTFTFTKPGEYPYYCSIHPVMVGWITVQ